MKILFSLIFALCSLSFIIKNPGPPPPVYQNIQNTPVFVYGTITDVIMDESNNINAKLTVRKVIKGNIGNVKILSVSFPSAVNRRAPESTRPKITTQLNETKVFGLYQNDKQEWIDRRTHFLISESGRVDIFGATYSLTDFKAGIALFESKYTYFQEKKANNTSIVLENSTKNQTFAFLAKEMMGNLIYTPKIVRKVAKKATGKRRKVKKK